MTTTSIDLIMESDGRTYRSGLTCEELDALGYEYLGNWGGDGPDDEVDIYRSAEGCLIGLGSGDPWTNDECEKIMTQTVHVRTRYPRLSEDEGADYLEAERAGTLEHENVWDDEPTDLDDPAWVGEPDWVEVEIYQWTAVDLGDEEPDPDRWWVIEQTWSRPRKETAR